MEVQRIKKGVRGAKVDLRHDVSPRKWNLINLTLIKLRLIFTADSSSRHHHKSNPWNMGSPFGHHQRPPPEASPATPSPFTPPRAKRYWVSSCALQRIQDRGCIDPLHGREVLLAGYCRQQFQPPPASTPTPIRLQSSTLLFRERERCARTLRLVTTVPATAIGSATITRPHSSA